MVIYAFMHTEMHIIVSITLYFYLSYINVTVAVQVLDLPNRMDGKPNFAQKECMHKLSFTTKIHSRCGEAALAYLTGRKVILTLHKERLHVEIDSK
jgi:hypothetical protein